MTQLPRANSPPCILVWQFNSYSSEFTAYSISRCSAWSPGGPLPRFDPIIDKLFGSVFGVIPISPAVYFAQL
jgi:hypothetical protein